LHCGPRFGHELLAIRDLDKDVALDADHQRDVALLSLGEISLV
jgi:hypothetical protein